MNARRVGLVSLLLLLPLSLIGVASQTPSGSPPQPVTTPTDTVDLTQLTFKALTPDPKSDIELPVMEVNLAPDGTLRIHHMFRTKARTMRGGYGWHVDLRTMTYRTFRLTQDGDEARFMAYLQEQRDTPALTPVELARVAGGAVRRELSAGRPPAPIGQSLQALLKLHLGLGLVGQKAQKAGPRTLDEPCDCCPSCACSGWHELNAQSIDPVGAVLTNTHAGLGWQSTIETPSQCNMEVYPYPLSVDECTGMAPTSAGTNWYRIACDITGEDFDRHDRFGYGQTRGIYFNNDFPPSLGENVYVDETAYNYVNATDSGHGAIQSYSGAWTHNLLSGRIYNFYGYNSCLM